MAIVQTKNKDSRYAHLEKLYSKDSISDDSDNESIFDSNDTKELYDAQQIKLTRKDILRDAGIFLLLGLLATCGYLLFKFI